MADRSGQFRSDRTTPKQDAAAKGFPVGVPKAALSALARKHCSADFIFPISGTCVRCGEGALLSQRRTNAE